MALTVNTNIASMNAVGNLNSTTGKLSSTLGRISSGTRITKAGDDAAGLAVAENLSAISQSARAAKRNIGDGVSVVQIAEGATEEVGNIIKRMRELAVQSASETLNDDERTYIQDEYTELSEEINRIAAVTEFNGTQLADGTAATLNVQVGVNDTGDDQIEITLGDLTGGTLGTDGLDLATSGGATAAIGALDTALDTVNQYRSNYGSVQNRLESAARNLDTYSQNVAAAESTIRDADFAYEAAEMSKFQIMQQAGVAALGQANQINSGATRLIG
jgi:flagellin